MARTRSPDRDKAFEMWKASDGKKKLIDIAAELGVSDTQIQKWKNLDKWEDKRKVTLPNSNSNVTKKKGPPYGSKNALGNKGGSAPKGNKNAEKHGFFSKHLPDDVLDVIKEIEQKDPIDLLWDNIVIQYAAIIRAQRIMYVRDKEDETKLLKKSRDNAWGSEEEWEIQYAWDKQANFLQAQSRAMDTLQKMIKQYEELTKSELASEEQKLRIAKLKAEIAKITDEDDETEDDGFIEALNAKVSEVWDDAEED